MVLCPLFFVASHQTARGRRMQTRFKCTYEYPVERGTLEPNCYLKYGSFGLDDPYHTQQSTRSWNLSKIQADEILHLLAGGSTISALSGDRSESLILGTTASPASDYPGIGLLRGATHGVHASMLGASQPAFSAISAKAPGALTCRTVMRDKFELQTEMLSSFQICQPDRVSSTSAGHSANPSFRTFPATS